MKAARSLTIAVAGLLWGVIAGSACAGEPAAEPSPGAPLQEAPSTQHPYVVVLGIAQDGGYPQIGTPPGPQWEAANRRLVSSLGLVDPVSGERWLFDATPDIAEQLARLEAVAPRTAGQPLVDGVFVTHAHIGHYTGLMQFGREALGAEGIVVHAMPRMRAFLESNGPWAQLVELGNVRLAPLEAGVATRLNARISVTPLEVPHRDEYSETVGFVIDAAGSRALYLPDIDKWERWDDAGMRLEAVLEQVDVAWIDGTFLRDGEIPGRAMSEIPHPLMSETMDRIEVRAPHLKPRVRFIHLNRTNPALLGGETRPEITARGFHVAVEGETWVLQGG